MGFCSLWVRYDVDLTLILSTWWTRIPYISESARIVPHCYCSHYALAFHIFLGQVFLNIPACRGDFCRLLAL
jgi:hypothetical protein